MNIILGRDKNSKAGPGECCLVKGEEQLGSA
jgi:hypothetical protein